jgi:hypothetical protein
MSCEVPWSPFEVLATLVFFLAGFSSSLSVSPGTSGDTCSAWLATFGVVSAFVLPLVVLLEGSVEVLVSSTEAFLRRGIVQVVSDLTQESNLQCFGSPRDRLRNLKFKGPFLYYH